MAGGNGTRLDPVTRAVNKHLLPIYDRPMIYGPLGALWAIGIREALVVTRPQDQDAFRAVIPPGFMGMRIEYAEQRQPGGVAEGLLIGADFAGGEPVALALGDQLFLGAEPAFDGPFDIGARIYVQECADVSEYAVLERDAAGVPRAIEEKPAGPRGGLAVTGLYLLDGRAAEVAQQVERSQRGELEIVDVLRWYLGRGELEARVLPPTAVWADLGTFDRLLAAGSLVQRRRAALGRAV